MVTPRDKMPAYSPLSITLHWLTAFLVFGLFGIGWYMVDLSYYDEMYNVLPLWHKSVGMLFAGFLMLRICWRVVVGKPEPLSSHKPYEVALANIAQFAMLLMLVVICLTGYLIPTAAGKPIEVFDWFAVPALVSDLANQEDLSGFIHQYLSYAFLFVVLLHSLAAVRHHFFDRDQTLKRMLGIN